MIWVEPRHKEIITLLNVKNKFLLIFETKVSELLGP